jgi:hypothetical protein
MLQIKIYYKNTILAYEVTFFLNVFVMDIYYGYDFISFGNEYEQ